MKKTLLRSCTLLITALLLLPVILLFSAFALPPQYGQTFLGEMPDKLRLLETAPGKRIVIIGGSSVPFALNSALLEEQLPEYKTVDFGMYADMGTVVMLDWAKSEVHPGDLFIIAPEQNAQALSCYVGGEDVWQASDGAFRQLGMLPSRRWEALAAAFPAFAGKKLGYFLTGTPKPEGVYAKSSFNAYGDIDCPDRGYNILSQGYDPNNAIPFSPDVISQDFIEELNDFAREVYAQGAAVLYHFPPMNAAALAPGTTQTNVDSYYDYLQSQLLFPILGDPNRCVLDGGWFYDSNFHLNASGATVFTKLMAEDIKLYLGDTSPTDIPLPAMPVLPTAHIQGNDDHAGLFTYRREKVGWVAEGLTDEGRAKTELVVPTHYQGEPVTGIDQNLFAGNTAIVRITLQSNAGTLYDGMFRGCSRLRELILTGERPSDYAVGDGLMNGARFMIYVPDGAVDNYRRNYFWQAYDAYLLPMPVSIRS